MSINQRQFEQLTEMGISLWQKRSESQNANLSSNQVNKQSKHYLDIDLPRLTSQQLFNDILLAMGLSIGEISHQNDHLDLGVLNWYFLPASSKNTIQKIDQQLFTPPIAEISKSPSLKKALWQLLTKHN